MTNATYPKIPAISDLLTDPKVATLPDTLDCIEPPDWHYDARSGVVSDMANELGLLLGEEHEADDDYDEHNHDAESAVWSAANIREAIQTIAGEMNWAVKAGDRREAEKIWEAVVSEVAKLVVEK